MGGVRPPVQWSHVRFPQVCSGSCAVRLPARVPAATAQRSMSRRRQVHAHALTHFQVTNLECIWEKESTCVAIVRAVAVILSAVVLVVVLVVVVVVAGACAVSIGVVM